MKTIYKRALSLVMIFAMAIGIIPMSAIAVYAADDAEYPALVLDEEVVISTDEYEGGDATFSFVPTETAYYSFYSYNNDFDTYGYLYDSEMNEITGNDDGGEDTNFKINYTLTAGETYYFKSRPYYRDDASGAYTVKLTKLPAATSITIDEGDSLSGYVGDYAWLYVSFDPEDAYEEVTWESDNTSVVTVDENGRIEFIGVGTATVTATSESGLEDSITITVKAIPEIELGSEVTVEINNEGEEARYYFTPTETDIYNFTVIGDEYYYIEVYEADTNERVFYAYGYNINRSVELTANTTYHIVTGYSDTGSFALSVTKAPSATSIEITYGDEMSGYIGDIRSLWVEFSPDGSAPETLTWESNNTSVVTVDEDGDLEFVGIGTATVTVTSERGLTDSIVITVIERPAATSITINKGDSLSGYVGDYTWLRVFFDPEGAYEEVTWESDNTSVVTVSKYGKLEFVGAGTATVTVRSESGLEDSITITVKAIPTLVLGEEVVGHADSDSDGTFEKFSFVPDVTGEYVFYSYNTDFYISVYLYDSEGYRLASDYADNGNFRIRYTLTAGETYYFSISIEAPDGTPNGDEYTVVLQKAVPATSISLAVGSEYSGYIGEYHYIDVVFDPVYSIMESVEWISSDPDVVCIDDYDNGWCRIYLKAVGTATITATSESDLTFTCTITVKDYETIELDEEKNVVLSGNAMYYYFTPDEDGYYSFYSYNGDCDPYGKILDSDMNEIASNDDGAKDYNFNVKCYLQAGVKYILVSRTYGGAEGSFSVSVKKTKVITDLEIVSMPDKTEYVKGFRPEELSFDGLELKVTWSDGSITYWEYDGELYIDDEEIDGDVEEFEDSIVFTLMCGEGSVDITITLVESPVSSIAVTKLPDRLEFIRGYDPDFIGLELTITYKDGTTKVVTLTEENLAYEVDIDEGVIYYTVDVDGNTLIIYKSGYDCYSAYYLGAECEIRDITFTQSKEIESVELDNVFWNGHGMIVKITYTDGTSETLTMDVVDYEFVMGGGSDLGVAVCAKTGNGLLWCGIITYIDENGNVEGYDVYILDGVITVDASDLLIGDVNGDGSVDNLDRLVLTRYLADWEGYSAADINMAAADVNNDLSVDNLDRLILTRHLANWEGYEELPID